MARTYSTDEVMAMTQAPREDVQMLDKPASPFLDPAQINAAERELSDDPNFFVDQTPAPQRPDGGNAALYPSKQETQPSLPKPVYSTDEVMALYTNESKPVYSTQDVMKQMIAPLYDPTAPRPSRDEYFKLKDMEKSLKESGDIEDPGAFEIGARAVGGLLVTAADALATATFKVDPKDALFTVGGIGVNPSKAIDDTLKRKDATVRLAGEFVKQQYNAMSEGLAAIGGPKYRVKETGEFITSMQQGLDAAKMGQAGGMGGVPAADDSALIERYKKQGLTLAPVGEDDLKDWEYLQWGKKMDRNLAIEQAATTPRPPDVLYRLATGIKPSVTDYITGRNDYAEAVAPVLANESQANVLSMAIDPMVWATSGAGATTRLGISAAAKGATAETLGILGRVAQKVVKPTEQALTKAEAFKKLIVSPAKVASAYGAASGVAWAADKLELPSELKSAAFTAASLYGAYKAGLGVLRFTANKLPEASVILRESANATNGFDAAARKAVAANADVPFSIRERLLRPGQFVAMESTPARLAKNMELSPGTRAMMDKLSNWYVVQGVRGASAVATGAVKGAAAGVPFAELMRSAGDDESAAAIYGMGAAFGSAGGAAERALGARGRRYAQAESDIARFLTDVQGNTTGLKDVKRYNWIDTEVGRLLTDVELGAGDVSALVKNRSFDELARTAAMQGFFRDRVDFVPLSAADFALNAKGHGADGSAGYFLNAPDGQRPRIFVNVEARRADVEPHEFYEAFFSSDAFSPEQKASMRAAVDNRYGADGLMARGREYAESLIKAENSKNFPNENLFVTSEQIAAKMDQLAQDELGRGGQEALDWVRREVMVEEARMAGIDYAAMRRNVPAGQNPITFIENLLGANARALGLSGVRVDPETGMAITPEQLFKENPVAANDPKLVKQLNGYLKTYKQWLNDAQHETPKGTRIAPDGRAESLANNPNVKFYDGVNGKENSIAFVDASGRVIEKTPKQRAKERKLRGQQILNMVGSKILEPSNTTFGLKRWADGRIRAGGKRLPDVMALQTHWKAHLPVIRSIEALSDAGESQQVLYFAKGNSADKVKSSRLSDIDAINREMVFDQWTTNAAGDLLAQFLDLTSVRNRAMKAIAERHPALDPANGGPGYKLQAIMDDVNQWMADKGAGKAGEATIGVPRKNVVNALINPGTNFNRGRNDLAGAFGRGSAIKTLLLEGINAVSGTGRKGAAMDYAWANGNFMPDKPAPRPNMEGDLAPRRTIKDLSTDQILRELEENQGYLGLSTLGMREGRPVKDGAQQTRELLRRNDALNEELRRRGGPQEESDVERVLRQRGQAMPDVLPESADEFMAKVADAKRSAPETYGQKPGGQGGFWPYVKAAVITKDGRVHEGISHAQVFSFDNNDNYVARDGTIYTDNDIDIDGFTVGGYFVPQKNLTMTPEGLISGARNFAKTGKQKWNATRGQAMPDVAVTQDGLVQAPEDAQTFKLPQRAMAQFMPDTGVDLADYADRTILALPADRMGIGSMMVGPKGKEREVSVKGQGGAGFMEIYNGGGWAFSDEATGNRFMKRLREAAEPGEGSVLVGITAMSEFNHLKNQTGQLAYVEALEAAIAGKSISKKQADAHIKAISQSIVQSKAKSVTDSTRRKFAAIKNFNDFAKAVRNKSLNFADAAPYSVQIARRALPIPYKEAKDIGIAFDDIGKQTADPRYADVPFGTVVALLEVPLDQAPVRSDFHYSYPFKVTGRSIGFLKQYYDVGQLTSDPRIRNSAGAVQAQPLQTVLPKLDQTRRVTRGQAMPDVADAPPFYLKSSQAIDSKVQGKAATPDQIKAILTNPQNGIKAEELKWTGVMQEVERLAKENNGKVPKDALLRYLAEDGAVRFDEVTMGGAKKQWTQADIDQLEGEAQRTRDFSAYERAVLEYEDQQLGSDANNTGNQTRYGQYQLPGGENYREVVLSVPPKENLKKALRDATNRFNASDSPTERAELESQIAAIESAMGMRPREWMSSHFQDVPNYIAHMRLNERVDAKGKPGLFIEELQSDRHQQGREHGYKEPFEQWIAFYDAGGTEVPIGYGRSEKQALESIDKNWEGLVKIQTRKRDGVEGVIPDAPFRTSWPLQLFKRALRDAVADGKEWIGWTTGETQAARYDLSKQVDSVNVSRGGGETWEIWADKDGRNAVRKDVNSIAEVAEVIGKELAKKVEDMKPGEGARTFSGVDLKVGGEGMKGFYDTMVPKEVAKYVKQWGAQVEKGKIGEPKQGTGRMTRDEVAEARKDARQLIRGDISVEEFNDAHGTRFTDDDVPGNDPYQLSVGVQTILDTMREQRKQEAGGSFMAWRVNITRQMREGIKKAGQALFVGGAAAVVAEDQLEQ